MSPGTNVKTLKIDGRDVSARQEETILDVARQNNIFIPTPVRPGRPLDRWRLPPVPGRDQGLRTSLLPACVTRVEEGMEVTTDSERLHGYRRIDSGTALHRAQSHLLGLRLQRPLRTADPGAAAWGSRTFTSPIAIPRSRSMPRTTASSSITTAASCAPAACVCATRSKARIPGT